MSTCGQCEYYLTKMDECPHPEKRALNKACDKLQYTNPRKRIDYLQAENKQLRDWLIEERLPNFCTGVECGCVERVGEARRKARIKLRQELEQALKGGK